MNIGKTIIQFLKSNDFRTKSKKGKDSETLKNQVLRIIDNLPYGILVKNQEDEIIICNSLLKDWFPELKKGGDIPSEILNHQPPTESPEGLAGSDSTNQLNKKNIKQIHTTSGIRNFKIYSASLSIPKEDQNYVMHTFFDLTEQINAQTKLKKNKIEISLRHGISSISNSFKDLRTICEQVLELIIQNTGYDYGGIYILNENTKRIEKFGNLNSLSNEVNSDILFGKSLAYIKEVLKSGDPLFKDLTENKGSENITQKNALAVIPLKFNEKIIGIMTLVCKNVITLNENINSILTSVSKDIGNAIEFANVSEAKTEAERRYDDLYENSGDIMYTTNLKGDVTSANKRALEFFGYSKEDLEKGINISQVLSMESYKIVIQRMQNRLTGLESNKPHQLEIKKSNGERAVMQYEAHLIYEHGQPVGIHGKAVDITPKIEADERFRKSEERYRSLIESSEDIVFSQDTYGRFLYYHGTGDFKAEPGQIEGKRLDEIIDKLTADSFNSKVREVFKSNKPVRFQLLINWMGKETMFSISLAPLRDNNGKVVSVTGIGRDVTDIVSSQHALGSEC